MKKLISLLLVLLFLMPAGGAALAENTEGFTEISDLEGLLAIADDPDGKYLLTADIDMAGVIWTPIPFRGTLDGAGHTLYNLKVESVGVDTLVTRDGNLIPYDTVFAGLFSVMEHATIRDLKLVGAELSVESDEHCFVGLLAGYMYRCSIQGCSVQGKARLVNHAVQTGIGGIVGYGAGDFGYCRADVELVFEDRNLDQRCEQFMGGILSCGLVNIEDCVVHIDGYDSCHGYVHNGGLVGMYYHCGMRFTPESMANNYISGFISFFEDNPDRRAYCAATFGEHLQMPRRYTGNRDDFERRETRDYSTVLSPEKCAEPVYNDEVVPPGCDVWGFTHHTCLNCGYSWADSYTPPQHTPGEWRVSIQPTVDREGQEQLRCAVCDALLDERTVPALVRVESCRLDRRKAELYCDETLRLNAAVLPENASDGAVRWSSSDPSVATVDENGLVRAHSRGTALITAQTADGYGRDTCSVTVKYSLIQWLRSLFSGRA